MGNKNSGRRPNPRLIPTHPKNTPTTQVVSTEEPPEEIESVPVKLSISEQTKIPDGFKDLPVDIQQMLLLRQLNYSYAKIAKLTGRDRVTVYKQLKRYDEYGVLSIAGSDLKSLEAARWQILRDRCIDAVTDEKLEKANAHSLTVMAAISQDKSQKILEENKPSVSINIKNMSF